MFSAGPQPGIVSMILAIIPFLLLCLASSKVNLKKTERSKQFPMPFVALAYCIAVFILVVRINNGLTSAVNSISGLAGRISPQAGAAAQSFIGRLNLNYWIFYISNTVIIAAFLILKKIVISVLKRVFRKDNGVHLFITGYFYEYDAANGVATIKPQFGQMRTLFRTFYYAAAVLSTALFLLCRVFMNKGWIATPFYPVFGILIVGELFFFLDGLISREYLSDTLGEDESSREVVNYSIMRNFLRSLFGEHLAAEDASTNSGDSPDTTNDEVVEALLLSEDAKTEAFGRYIKSLVSKGADLDHNYVYSALDMLCGKSVLFNNPFYNDLAPYAFYPMNRCLLRHKKVMVVLGRHGIEEDVRKWLAEGFMAVTNIPNLWEVSELGGGDGNADVGIITRSNVHNLKLHDANREFFSQVELVVIIEPSRLISTAQIGLNSLVKYCRSDSRDIVFCACDKNCDGLVDALSHILMTSISEVSAINKHLGTMSNMCWDHDRTHWHHKIVPGVSRYLGIGTELSFAALKNQIQTAAWYGGEAYPVVDQFWIARQYYHDLLSYAGLPTGQEAMAAHFLATPNFWSARVEKNQYMTVEDESNNMFEIVRAFATRAKEQGFVNIISPEYMLKDYMAYNHRIFSADPKAIPYIVADFARTRRNTALRLMLMLAVRGLPEDEIQKELLLTGQIVGDVRASLWFEIVRCYASVDNPPGSAGAMSERIEVFDADGGKTVSIGSEAILTRMRYNISKGEYEKIFYISDAAFVRGIISELQSADYITEDEESDRYFMGAELLGHVFQRHLPGQFFTFSGKYYEMCRISADNHVIVRRAADHITGRPAYRQKRVYTILSSRVNDDIGAVRSIGGIVVTNEYADIRVETPAYLDMTTLKDFCAAREVAVSGIPARTYKNKQILKIEFPDVEDNVRYTITVLLNELFRTVFAENQPFISAVTFLSEEDAPDVPTTYELAGAPEENRKSIYIIEDSQLDMGLMIAFDRNFRRLLECICDYLDWHIGEVGRSESPTDAEPESGGEEPAVDIDPVEDIKVGGGKKGRLRRFFRRILDKIKGIFTRKRIKAQYSVGSAGGKVNASAGSKASGNAYGSAGDDGVTATAEEEVTRTVGGPGLQVSGRAPYHLRHYLLFGYGSEPPGVRAEETRDYLAALGFLDNPLKQARDSSDSLSLIEETYDPSKQNAHFCDFCAVEMTGAEYEVLADGRERCMNCGKTAVKTEAEFTRILKEAKRNMEALFGIQINVAIRAEMVNAKKLNRKMGRQFVPTPGFDLRMIGLATRDRSGNYTIFIENGSPRLSSIKTIVHELTHIWQYVNWNDKKIAAKYGKELENAIYEGMARWVEIQYTYLINEPAVAKRSEILTKMQNDDYGKGFRLFLEKYPFSPGSFVTNPTPFEDKENPL